MPRKDGQYPVKIRVTFERNQKYYTIRYVPEKIGPDFTDYQKYWMRKTDKSISMTEQEFERIRKGSSTEPYKTMAIYLNTQEAEAQATIAKIRPFSFESFTETYFAKTLDDQDVFAILEKKAADLRSNGKINTATTYESTLNSLKDFAKSEKCSFSNISVQFLKDYETWMLGRKIGKKNPRNISKTTISMYLRCLRAVFNESAPEDVFYPFSSKKSDRLYKIPKWNHNKRALAQGDVANIAAYHVIEGSTEHRSRDLWLFSYLCNGINFKDMANLKYRNIKGDLIVFERAKTAESNNSTNDITVVITRQIGRIIDLWGNKPARQDQYIFPFLTDGMTPEVQALAIKQMIKTTNKYMKRICADLEIPPATTYVARHSFATVLKRSGASVEFISESLGHKSIPTTQNYLASFEIDEKRKWAEMLLPDPDEVNEDPV